MHPPHRSSHGDDNVDPVTSQDTLHLLETLHRGDGTRHSSGSPLFEYPTDINNTPQEHDDPNGLGKNEPPESPDGTLPVASSPNNPPSAGKGPAGSNKDAQSQQSSKDSSGPADAALSPDGPPPPEGPMDLDSETQQQHHYSHSHSQPGSSKSPGVPAASLSNTPSTKKNTAESDESRRLQLRIWKQSYRSRKKEQSSNPNMTFETLLEHPPVEKISLKSNNPADCTAVSWKTSGFLLAHQPATKNTVIVVQTSYGVVMCYIASGVVSLAQNGRSRFNVKHYKEKIFDPILSPDAQLASKIKVLKNAWDHDSDGGPGSVPFIVFGVHFSSPGPKSGARSASGQKVLDEMIKRTRATLGILDPLFHIPLYVFSQYSSKDPASFLKRSCAVWQHPYKKGERMVVQSYSGNAKTPRWKNNMGLYPVETFVPKEPITTTNTGLLAFTAV